MHKCLHKKDIHHNLEYRNQIFQKVRSIYISYNTTPTLQFKNEIRVHDKIQLDSPTKSDLTHNPTPMQ